MVSSVLGAKDLGEDETDEQEVDLMVSFTVTPLPPSTAMPSFSAYSCKEKLLCGIPHMAPDPAQPPTFRVALGMPQPPLGALSPPSGRWEILSPPSGSGMVKAQVPPAVTSLDSLSSPSLQAKGGWVQSESLHQPS